MKAGDVKSKKAVQAGQSGSQGGSNGTTKKQADGTTKAAAPSTSTAGQSTSAKTASTNPNDGMAIQVIFLPDFEEQYAIRNKNFLAKTQYQYTFSHGTELDTMSGTYGAVDVPVKILETIGNLITAAGSVATQKLTGGGGAAKSASSSGFGGTGDAPTFYIRTKLVIEPGVYRLQKSWERAARGRDTADRLRCRPGTLRRHGTHRAPGHSDPHRETVRQGRPADGPGFVGPRRGSARGKSGGPVTDPRKSHNGKTDRIGRYPIGQDGLISC